MSQKQWNKQNFLEAWSRPQSENIVTACKSKTDGWYDGKVSYMNCSFNKEITETPWLENKDRRHTWFRPAWHHCLHIYFHIFTWITRKLKPTLTSAQRLVAESWLRACSLKLAAALIWRLHKPTHIFTYWDKSIELVGNYFSTASATLIFVSIQSPSRVDPR